MIPYFEVRPFFGFIQPFGLLVVCAILVGAYLMRRRAEQLGEDRHYAIDLATWMVVAGFIGAHLFDMVAYRFDALRANPWLLVDVRKFTISSFGGFGGAVIGLFLWRWRRGHPVWRLADATAFGLVPAWTFGRLGCFVAHDHPGHRSDFVLAVQYPGGSRHDLGLYEAIFAFVLGVAFLIAGRRPRRVGTYLAVTCLVYAPVRFGLDFLRATDLPRVDTRYFGLTPAQYATMLLFAVGLVIAWRTWGPGAPAAPPVAAVPPADPDAAAPPAAEPPA
jgi:phosphatidylglycerol:prolipoprotein diacylglycerol transferase